MTNIQRYRANDLAELFDKITKNSIGLDSYIDQFWQTTAQTYPPYSIVQHNNHESSLEIALAGFKKKEVKVYTCLLYTSPSPRDRTRSRMPSSA